MMPGTVAMPEVVPGAPHTHQTPELRERCRMALELEPVLEPCMWTVMPAEILAYF